MKKTLLGLAALALVACVLPGPASAGVSVFLGLPGFGFFAGPPVYAPPVVVAPPPVYYAPPVVVGPYAPAYYGQPYYRAYRGHGWHRGWYPRGRGYPGGHW